MGDVLIFENFSILLNNGRYLIRNLNLALRENTKYSLLGLSGEGKSSLLKSIIMVNNENLITKGNIYYKGELLTEQSIKKIRGNGISYMTQEPGSALHPIYKIESILKKQLRLHKNSDIDIQSALDFAALDRSVLKLYPFELSGGMKQRVLLALLYTERSSLILLDEPTSALDRETEELVLSRLEEKQRRDGSTILSVTHLLASALRWSDELLALEEGSVKNFYSSNYGKELLSVYKYASS